MTQARLPALLLLLLTLPAATVASKQAAQANLPAEGSDHHLGVASCASSVCHGSVVAGKNAHVRLNEYVTWAHEDAHSRAFQALQGEQGRAIAARLGLGRADQAGVCLDCHSDHVPAALRGPKFTLTDGVGCEACHGGAERWVATHASGHSSYAEDVARGLYPSAGLPERARLCASCHLGSQRASVTHRILGAGHPRLSFELDTYLALEPPHYDVNAGYRARKPAASHTQTWALGQLQLALQQLDLLQGPGKPAQSFPELSLYDCYACHGNSMHRTAARRHPMSSDVGPGLVALHDAHWRMAAYAADALDAELGRQVRAYGRALQAAAVTGGSRAAEAARRFSTCLQGLYDGVNAASWSGAQRARALQAVVRAGVDGEFPDYLGAEQAVMAIDLMLIDSGQAATLRAERDALFKATRNDEAFSSDVNIAAMRALQSRLQ